MKIIKNNTKGVTYYYCPELESMGFKNMFTTKIGGVSFQKNEMNFGASCGDTKENIMKNYEKVFSILETDAEKTVKSKQTHSDIVLCVDSDFGGEGIIKEQRFFEADGLMTSDPDMTLLVFYADCVPVIIADKASKTVCAVHSGWRGTRANIVKNAVTKLIENQGSAPENLFAAIGPAIGVCHFEVQKNVYDEFIQTKNAVCTCSSDGKYFINLAHTVKNQLSDCGIPEENIALADICTYCDQSLYSYRREGESAGRMAAFIKTPHE